jgi:HlyD family secretion protein
MQKIQLILFLGLIILVSCKEEAVKSDAYGNFEATTTVVSAKSSGQLIQFTVEEGQRLEAGKLVGIIDTTQLHLQRKLLYSQLGTIGKKITDPNPDIAVLEKQKSNLIREKNRLENLVSAKAATTKQLDDIDGQIKVLEQQITAAKNKARTINTGILAEKEPIQAQIDIINQKIKDSYVYNPLSGTVINKLREPSEMVGFGNPLYSIANLKELTLRAYTDALQMQGLKVGDQVTILIDNGEESMRPVDGLVTWIADEAEFTPKVIQTKKERVNLVYAIKIKVVNDGRLKLGMPAEVKFKSTEEHESSSQS